MTTPIRDSYWVSEGKLLAGEYPGARDHAQARTKLEAFVRSGIRTFVDLTEQDEGLAPYESALAALARERTLDLRYRRFAVRDVGLPANGVMPAVLTLIASELAEGRPVYVHCWGGIGRTGTAVGCWLVEHGMAPDEALDRIATLRRKLVDRAIRSPETDAQCDFVRGWRAGSLAQEKL
jgi:protein tyrosine/serine phosphatase